jgi:hypothetical protein
MLLYVLFMLPLLALGWSLHLWNPFGSGIVSSNGPVAPKTRKSISHQASSDPHQDVLLENAQWYDDDGEPLFYSAWRACVQDGHPTPEPTERSKITIYGARVACWPSSGGVWIKHADLVELDFMGVNRLRNTLRQFNQTAEDEFCTKLKLVGADWWQLPPPFDEQRGHLGREQYACATLEDCIEPDFQNRFFLAWPETITTACYVPKEDAVRVGGELLGGYRNAMNMEERCDVINSLGGKICYCREECPEIEYLDWSFRNPGPDGCSNYPLRDPKEMDEDFDPKPSKDVLRWANKYCERNGWKRA